MHEFGSAPKSRMRQDDCNSVFYYLRDCLYLPGIVNQKNTIKGMIPQRLLELVPSSVRDKWANRVVEKVKENNPALYAAMGDWSSMPEDERQTVVNEILVAAEKIHWEIRNASQ